MAHSNGRVADHGIGSHASEGIEPGQAVLGWLGSSEAVAVARRALFKCGFGGGESTVEDVLSDARVAVLTRLRSATPFEPDNPAAYGTVVVRNVVNRLTRGDIVYLQNLDDLDDHEAPPSPPADATVSDDLRMLLEARSAPAWLTSAALAHLCLLMAPDAVPHDAPSPQAGARPEQALVWPALWFAGERDLFPRDGADPRKRARARRIRRVLEHQAEVFSRYRAAEHHG